MRHCRGKVAQPGVSVLGGKLRVSTDELENEIMTTIQRMEREMCGLSTNYVRRLAYIVADRMEFANKATGMAGRDGLSQFMKRHPAESIRAPIATSIARINGFNRHAIEDLFVVLKSVLQSGSFNALHIWNCDETGFTTVARVYKVVSTKGARQVRKCRTRCQHNRSGASFIAATYDVVAGDNPS